MKKKFEVINEKAADNQLWGRIHYGEDLLTTNAKNVEGIIENFREQLEAFYDLKTTHKNFEVKYDLEAFFDQYNVLNISEIGKMANISPTVMRHYKTGIKHPSKAQLQNIEQTIHALARQLEQIKISV